ncbi:MAG: hypothetical protein KME26_23845 [Oscillatoria princeps RMCB-10]|nr:hypothetical protein [Oscillatoria princeps RMCB-10]
MQSDWLPVPAMQKSQLGFSPQQEYLVVPAPLSPQPAPGNRTGGISRINWGRTGFQCRNSRPLK